jgi:hypothetical protein
MFGGGGSSAIVLICPPGEPPVHESNSAGVAAVFSKMKLEPSFEDPTRGPATPGRYLNVPELTSKSYSLTEPSLGASPASWSRLLNKACKPSGEA